MQGNIWSQYAIDGQDGDGSIIYPYYPSKEHFCKPAQNDNDFIDCINLDGWTVDFVAGRMQGDFGEFWDGEGWQIGKDRFCSRMGVIAVARRFNCRFVGEPGNPPRTVL